MLHLRAERDRLERVRRRDLVEGLVVVKDHVAGVDDALCRVDLARVGLVFRAHEIEVHPRRRRVVRTPQRDGGLHDLSRQEAVVDHVNGFV